MRTVAAIFVALGLIIPTESHGQAVVVQYARHVNGPPTVVGDSGRSYAIADRTIETLSTDPRPTYLVKVNVQSIDDVRAIHAMAQDLSRALEQEAARASVDFVAIWAIVATSAGPINYVKRWGFTFERDSKGVWAEVHPPSEIK